MHQQQLGCADTLLGDIRSTNQANMSFQESNLLMQTEKMILDEMNVRLLDVNSLYLKTSKRVLNQNAIKFRLMKLNSRTIRYEVIYKNLVRDLRKHYSCSFNSFNHMRTKHYTQNDFTQFLQYYIKITFGKYLYLHKLDISMEDLVFNLGSLIHPKMMLKVVKDSPYSKLNVVKIFNYLYKFSLERLQQFLNNKSLMLLLCEYLRTNHFQRIHGSNNMCKYRFAYYEACAKMLH